MLFPTAPRPGGMAEGKNYIEIHHLEPICEYEGETELDLGAAIENVTPLCANWPDAVSGRLWDSYENDSTVRIRIVYAPDGCGWSGDPCDRHLWTDFKSTIPEEFINYGLPKKKEKKASKDLVCRRDLACWAKKHHVDAEVTCQ